MSWAEDKAADVRRHMPIAFFGNADQEVRRAIERAIRETIEKCADVAAEPTGCGDDECREHSVAEAIRKLAEP